MLQMIPNSRAVYSFVFLGCVGLLSVALYMEHKMLLDPCPLCIFQRVMVLATGIVSLLAAIHGPKELGIKIYGGLMIVTAVIGGAISTRQLWLQSLPADEVPACGASLDYLMDVFPLTEVLSMVLTGDGSCAEVAWRFLGLSIPGWTLVGFIALVCIGIFQIIRPKT